MNAIKLWCWNAGVFCSARSSAQEKSGHIHFWCGMAWTYSSLNARKIAQIILNARWSVHMHFQSGTVWTYAFSTWADLDMSSFSMGAVWTYLPWVWHLSLRMIWLSHMLLMFWTRDVPGWELLVKLCKIERLSYILLAFVSEDLK